MLISEKKRKFGSLIVLISLLSGCTFTKHTIIKAKGDKLSIPLAGFVATAKGEMVEIELDRKVCIGKCPVLQPN